MKKPIRLRPYIVIIALIVVVFFISDYFIIRSIENNFFKTLETQYINYASIYSYGLTKTAEAYRSINDMLEKRIVSAIRTIALYTDQITNEALVDLADSLALDEIYLYNHAGEIEYSNNDTYLGWLATPGHPVHDFIISDLESYIEDIRRDTESDEYYKYGYLRLEDGRFVQVGVQATIVENFLAPFEIEQLLQEISGFDLVDHVYFINPDYSVSASDNSNIFDFRLDNPQILEAVESMTTYSLRRNVEGTNLGVYEIFIPIFVDEGFGGTLVVAKTTEEADAIVRTATNISIVISAIVFSGFIYIMISNYRHNKRLVSLAYKDALTGLSNKAHLQQILAETLNQPFSGKKAIIMIHCHNLSMINSTYGPNVGDRIIKELAIRLGDFALDRKQLFRYNGSRFVLFVQNYKTQDELSSLAERIFNDLDNSLDIEVRPIEIRIGIVELGPEMQAKEVLSQVSMAIHHLKEDQGNKKYILFDTKVEAKLRREEIIAHEMAEFLKRPQLGTFHLEYQPKVSLESNQIVGFEALSRMTSPTFGQVSPLEFISIAERQEMIVPLGYWVLETACQFIKKLDSEGYDKLYVAVNISVIQLLQDDFLSKVEEIVTKAGIKPQNLQIEITESVFIEDFDDIQAKLCPLRDLGLTIALDDFGTGYSALSRMGELPVDFIKIDKSFIDKILDEDDQRQIIEELIAMCHKLELIVVAEGVEYEQQREYLRKVGCDIIQGYLYSKPVVEELALEKLKELP